MLLLCGQGDQSPAHISYIYIIHICMSVTFLLAKYDHAAYARHKHKFHITPTDGLHRFRLRNCISQLVSLLFFFIIFVVRVVSNINVC